MTEQQSPVLDVRNVSVGFRRRRREPLFQALDDVSLTVPRGTTMGLVGESGSGKSTLAKAVLGLVPTQSGSVRLLGQDTTHLGPAARRKLGGSLQAVFQDPNSSLNPSYTVGRSLAEPMLAQGIRSRETIARRTTRMLEDVGLDPAAAAKYPRDFSGGQRQRISIARALMTDPQLVICDESVSALDLSVKAQILNLLADLQDGHGVGYLFISHDMSVVRHICHDVTVLYRGQVMEAGPTRLVTPEPAHPYTRALLLAAPVADPAAQRKRRAAATAGDLPSGDTQQGSGCAFAARCPFAQERCRQSRPEARTTADGRIVACHRYPEWRSEITTDTSR
ncbi:ABC transporter ATP-binding protein [Streptomyces sp. NPDC047042]|uniref:ABC transporter ATP-binding protein n=1 Tax=Streptomyces sp. NPDC047042 TaxID=3154807 RepID=UPI0033DD44C0